jgi:hypothetical protein
VTRTKFRPQKDQYWLKKRPPARLAVTNVFDQGFIDDELWFETAYRFCRDFLLRLSGASSARHNPSRVNGLSVGLSQFLQRIWDRKPPSELLLSQ